MWGAAMHVAVATSAKSGKSKLTKPHFYRRRRWPLGQGRAGDKKEPTGGLAPVNGGSGGGRGGGLWLGWAYLAKTVRKPQRGGVNFDPPMVFCACSM
jgi:hypothetical protein